MNRLKRYTIILTLLLSIVACHKSKDAVTINLSGSVKNQETNLRVSNATVKLFAQEVKNGSWSNIYKLLGSTLTDGSGNYSIVFEKSTAVNYKVEVDKLAYFQKTELFNSDKISSDNSNVRNYSIHSQAFFSVHIQNTSPFDSNDKLVFSLSTKEKQCDTCCVNQSIVYKGDFIDTNLNCTLYGDTWLKFNWTTTKDGTSLSSSDSIYCIPSDTAIFDLTY